MYQQLTVFRLDTTYYSIEPQCNDRVGVTVLGGAYRCQFDRTAEGWRATRKPDDIFVGLHDIGVVDFLDRHGLPPDPLEDIKGTVSVLLDEYDIGDHRRTVRKLARPAGWSFEGFDRRIKLLDDWRDS